MYSIFREAAATGVTVRDGKGFLKKIVLGDPGSNWEIEVYDGTSSAGTRIATIKRASQPVELEFNYNVSTGIFINAEKGTTVGDLLVYYADHQISN